MNKNDLFPILCYFHEFKERLSKRLYYKKNSLNRSPIRLNRRCEA